MDTHRNEFWAPSTPGDIASRQGITRPQPIEELIGAAADLWDDDQDFDQFLTLIDSNRREPASA